MVALNFEKPIKSYVKRNPPIISSGTSLREVAQIMAKDGHEVVVVMDDGTAKGLVSPDDLFMAMKTYVLGKTKMENFPLDIRKVRVEEILKGVNAGEFMEACGLTGHDLCVTLSEDETLANAVRTMAVTGVSHILVIGEEGISGTISHSGLLKAFSD